MTCNMFGGMLNLTLSIYLYNFWHTKAAIHSCLSVPKIIRFGQGI